MFRWTLWLLLALAACTAPPPASLSTEESHSRMLEQLGIDSLRRGVDGDPGAEHGANYDEARANHRMDTLPEVLVNRAGEPVTSREQWWCQRRPELLEQFETHLYGRPPRQPPVVDWQVKDENATRVAGHPVRRQRLAGEVDNSRYPDLSVTLEATLTLPRDVEEPVPAMVVLTLAPEVLERWADNMPEERREAFQEQASAWQGQLLERGWGYVELVATSVQPDSGAGLTGGIIGLTNRGQPREPQDWGALRAWGWGASRVLDYLEQRSEVDGERVGLFGHSRYGKAALVGMAFDQRFAVGYISSSGEGGAKLWRRDYGEQVGNIASTQLYHWMAGEFLKYAGPRDVTDLPVDQHQLLGLVAPRPVFLGAGLTEQGDGWVDPRGSFKAAVHATPIYRLLGAEGLSSSVYPEAGEAVAGGELAYRQHHQGHTPAPNWPAFLDFAERELGD